MAYHPVPKRSLETCARMLRRFIDDWWECRKEGIPAWVIGGRFRSMLWTAGFTQKDCYDTPEFKEHVKALINCRGHYRFWPLTAWNAYSSEEQSQLKWEFDQAVSKNLKKVRREMAPPSDGVQWNALPVSPRMKDFD